MTTDDTGFGDTLELLRRAKAGDGRCLDAVLADYGPRLLGRIRLMMGDEARRWAESGDFLQGVLVDAIRGIDRFEPRSEQAFLRWLARIARNNIADVVRRRREQSIESLAARSDEFVREPRSDAPSPSTEAERHERIDRLVDTLMHLSEDHRLVIELRHFEVLSFAEIGARMGRSENAAQILHNRALMRLGRLLHGGAGS